MDQSDVLLNVFHFCTNQSLFVYRQINLIWHQVIEYILLHSDSIECQWYKNHLQFKHLSTRFIVKKSKGILNAELYEIKLGARFRITSYHDNFKGHNVLELFTSDYAGIFFKQEIMEFDCGYHISQVKFSSITNGLFIKVNLQKTRRGFTKTSKWYFILDYKDFICLSVSNVDEIEQVSIKM